MLPPPIFEFCSQLTLGRALDPPKIAAVNLPIQKHHILRPGLTFDILWLANWWRWFFWEYETLPRLCWWPIQNLVGQHHDFFWNDPKSCIMSYLGGHDFWILSITFLNDYKFIKFYVKFMHCSYPAWQLTVQAHSLQAELHDCFKKTYLFLLLIDLMFMEILLTQFWSE